MCRAQGHCSMGIMSAGMHLSDVLRGILCFVLLKNQKCVHVCTNGYHLSTLADICNDSGFPDAAFHAIAHFFQLISHNAGRALYIEAGFRMHMKIASPLDQFFCNFVILFYHGILSYLYFFLTICFSAAVIILSSSCSCRGSSGGTSCSRTIRSASSAA